MPDPQASWLVYKILSAILFWFSVGIVLSMVVGIAKMCNPNFSVRCFLGFHVGPWREELMDKPIVNRKTNHWEIKSIVVRKRCCDRCFTEQKEYRKE